MRIGPFEFARRATTVEAAVATTPRSELGASGTINTDGYITSADYNPALVGLSGLRTYERMRRSDASVREALWHIFAPVINATWDVEPASDDPLDLEIAEFARMCFGEWLVEPFQQTMRTALLYLPQGFQVFEAVEQVVEAELTYDVPDGLPVTVPRRQFIAWRRFAHRRPETINKWIVESGELMGVQQMVMVGGSFEMPVIPAEALLVFTNEKEGDDFAGVSILRSAYKAWYLKEMIEKVAGMAYERHGVGVPVGYLPDSMRNNNAALAQLETMLKNMRAGAHHYLAFPGPKAGQTENGRDGYLVEILTPNGGIPDFLPFLEYLRGEIKGNVLARFAELGHGSTGARATGDVQSQVWYTALQGTANYVAAVFQDALERLIDRNYVTERYPKLVARDIESRNLTDYADATSKVVSSGAAVADRSLRAAVRDYFGWPDEDEVEEQLGEELEPEGEFFEEEPEPEPEEPEQDDAEPEAGG